jgi:hypothetical protein
VLKPEPASTGRPPLRPETAGRPAVRVGSAMA